MGLFFKSIRKKSFLFKTLISILRFTFISSIIIGVSAINTLRINHFCVNIISN
jgi:hypothetical protein